MWMGKELVGGIYETSLVWPENYRDSDEAEAARRRYNAEEALRAFETVLLLEPTNREAKLYLAACLRRTKYNGLEEAGIITGRVIEEPVQDEWAGTARSALHYSLLLA